MYEIGAGGRIRTPDLLITNQLLYQLSYTSVKRYQFYYFVSLTTCILYHIISDLSTLFSKKFDYFLKTRNSAL